LTPVFMLVSCLASSSSSTLKIEVTCFSKLSVDFQQITWHCVLEDRTFRTNHCENLKSYKKKIFHRLEYILV
jgi:hypothetical protein